MFLYRTLFTSSVVLFYDLSVGAGGCAGIPFLSLFGRQSIWTVYRVSVFFHKSCRFLCGRCRHVDIRDVIPSILSRAWRRVRAERRLLALAGMNSVRMLQMPGCLLRPVVKKHYCLFLSSVLRSSIALSLILWLSVERKCASTATSVPFSLSIYIYFSSQCYELLNHDLSPKFGFVRTPAFFVVWLTKPTQR